MGRDKEMRKHSCTFGITDVVGTRTEQRLHKTCGTALGLD
jgi:hypothetical protein